MSPNRFHAELGAPEEQPAPGMEYNFTQKCIKIAAGAGFRDLALPDLDGLLLALDWVAGNNHYIWGSAVMVAPGVALTACHVVDDMRARGFLAEAGGQLVAIGFHQDRMEVWRADSFTSVDIGDLALLTLIRSTGAPPQGQVRISLAKMAARMPNIGETLSLIGFRAAELSYTGEARMDLALVGSVGPVTDLYPARRDAHSLPNPSVAIAARTINGMSGGGAFDAEGRLVGVISSGIGEENSFVSLSWPAIYVPIAPRWPPMLEPASTTLGAIARGGLGIDYLDDVLTWMSEEGHQMVSISDPGASS